MNKILLLVVFVAFFTTKVTAQEWVMKSTPEFDISYPEACEIDENGTMGTSLIVYMPISTESAEFRNNFNIIVRDLGTNGFTLSMIGEATTAQLEQMFEGSSLLENKLIDGPNGQYLSLVYTGNQNGNNLYFRQNIYLNNSVMSLITYTCRSSDQDSTRATADRVFSSFKVK